VARIAQITRRYKQWRALSSPDKKVLFLSMFALPTIAFLLHTVGYKKTKSLLERFMPPTTSCDKPLEDEMIEVHNLARTIHRAARHNIYQANCLKQSLLLWFILGKKLISSELKFGIEKFSNCQLNAHAWVECGGQPLIDSTDTLDKFSVFENGLNK
jgi:hypothetical protein